MSAVVEWGYQDLRLVELVEELMLRQQEIAGLVQRLEHLLISQLLLLFSLSNVPGTGGAAATIFFGDMLVEPEKITISCECIF